MVHPDGWVAALFKVLSVRRFCFIARPRNLRTRHSPFLKLAFRLLTGFLLAVLGFALAFLVTGVLGATGIAWSLIQVVGPWFIRFAVIVICIMTLAIVLESIS